MTRGPHTHFYLSDENILHLDSTHEAALATYQREGAKLISFAMVQYPDEDKARLAYGSFMKPLPPGCGTLRDCGKWRTAGGPAARPSWAGCWRRCWRPTARAGQTPSD